MGKDEKEILELIDQYLLNRIHPEDLERLEHLRKENPEINLNVIRSKKAFHVLEYARVQQLRQALRQIDRETSKKDNLPPNRWLTILIILAGCLIVMWIWAYLYCRPVAIASHLFEYAPSYEIFSSAVNDEDIANWELAEKAFKTKNFEAAITGLLPFADHPDPSIAINARWNILLSRLAIEGPGKNWILEMKQFQSEAQEPFQTKATTLLRFIDSPFYQVATLRLSPKISAIKPRLL